MSLGIFFQNRAAAQALFLPSVGGGYSAMYPITRGVSFDTNVMTFKTGKEQRSQTRAGLMQFVLEYRDISAADVANFEAFFGLVNGSEVPFTFQFGLTPAGGLRKSYSNLVFQANEMSWTRTSEELYSGQLRFSQTATDGLAAPAAVVSPFPTFTNGLGLQGNSSRSRRGLNYISRMKCGKTWVMPLYDAGIPLFPTSQLRSWSIPLTLTDSDLAIIESHFVACCGKYREFTYIDPNDGSSHPHVRYSTDVLAFRHSSVNQTQVTVKLTEYAA